MDLKDCVFIGILSVNVIGLFLTARSFRRQTAVTDAKLYFQITEKMTALWRQYKDSKEKERDFEITELLNFMESLARLHCKRRIHGVTRDMVKEYLQEILPEIYQEDDARKILEDRSGPDTYGYLRRFMRSNRIKGIAHS